MSASIRTRNTRRHVRIVLPGLLAAMAVGGCAAGEDEAPPTASTDMPTVYADARVERLVDGANAGQAEYQAMLQACSEAGASTVPLSAEDGTLLGTGRLQWWITPERVALRREYWDLANSGDIDQCHFTLAHSGVHEYFDADRSVAFELPGMEIASEGPGEPDALLRHAVDPIDTELADAATSAGIERAAKTQVQGQPCQAWRSAQGTVCKWTGGGEWGFVASPGFFQATDALSESEIILQQEPAGGNGVQVTLTRFMLGEPWSRAALLPAMGDGEDGA